MSRRATNAIVVVALASVALGMYTAIRAHRDLTDFEVYRTAAVRAASAAPLYRPDDGHYQFKYLPAFAVAARPLAWMDDDSAKVVWFALMFAAAVFFVRTLVDGVPERRLGAVALVTCALVVLGKFLVRELALGQSNVLLGVLLLPAIVAGRSRPALAGACAGAAVFVKPYALVMLPWLAVTTPVVAIAASVAALAIGVVLPALVYGWSANLQLLAGWYRTVTDTTAPNLLHPDNVSVASLWAKWLGAGTPASVAAMATALVIACALIWVIAKGRAVRTPAYLEAGLLMLAMPLLSPQGWDYVLLLGAPVVVCVIDRWRELPTAARAVAIAIGVIFATPLRLFVDADTYNRVMSTGFVSIAAVALLGLAVLLRRRALA